MKKSSYHVGMAQKSGLHMIQKGSMVHAPGIMDDEAAEGESMGGSAPVNRPVASKSKISKPKKAKKKAGFFGY